MFDVPAQVWLGAIAIGLALPLLFVSIGSSEARGSVFARRARAGETTASLSEIILEQSTGERVVRPAMQAIASRLRVFTPSGVVDRVERRIELAGLAERWPIERVLVLKAVGGLLGLVIGYLFNGWVLALATGLFIYTLPDLLLDAAARSRQSQIQTGLADMIDHVTLSVEAGIGFEGALSRAAQAGHGPLADELRRTLQEMQLGATRSEALRNLADRNEVVDLGTFVSAVIQSEDYGLRIAHVLRVQSDELRTRRRQRAEENALKVPVKIVFPLVFCIFPALFIVLLGPAAARILTDALR